MMQIKDIGEAGLLQRIFPFCLAGTVGDDGAILQMPPDRSLVVTTDVLVDRVHFSDRTTSPADIGWRAAAANLSDLAAMGATPLGITVGLSLPETTEVAWVEELYGGLRDCLSQYQTGIIGGDLCRSTTITVAITALGAVDPTQAIRRDRAQADGAIVVTGDHGKSRGGLELLLNPDFGQSLSEVDRQALILAHQRPLPRLDVLPILRELQSPWIAGMDSSDGLLDAISQICRASSVGAIVENLPIAPALDQLRADPEDWILTGGEDFELVLCLPMDIAKILVNRLGAGAAIVGYTTAERSLIWRRADGEIDLERGYRSFHHF
jgi:thiamine-monophosphate kinase